MIVARRNNMRWRKACRKYRNYVFIGITLTLIAVQVYLYQSTPTGVMTAADLGRQTDRAVSRDAGLVARDRNTPTLFPDGLLKFSEQQNKVTLNNKRSVKKRGIQSRNIEPFVNDYKNNSEKANMKLITVNLLNNSFAQESSVCGELGKDAQSAFDRAQSVECKKEIAKLTCLHQEKKLYPPQLPRFCPLGGTEYYGRYIGCFQDDMKERILVDMRSEFHDSNNPMNCINHCLRSGFEYSGLQYGYECWCGVILSEKAIALSNEHCNMSCPGGNRSQSSCGAYLEMNIYRTGFGVKQYDYAGHVELLDAAVQNMTRVRIVFVLTVNGRAARQVKRLLKVIYRPQHYYYIHVDARQNYLHDELSEISKHLPNVRMSTIRYATIWGGASLLTMLMQCMRDLLTISNWHWDYFLNLSESDYPVKTVEELEVFLTKNTGKNFVKSHGKDTPRFMRKQGLNMLFYECDNHMWRLGPRDLQNGIRVDGGSDWICLYRDFVKYAVYDNDELLNGLKSYWKYALLPAESFFHTLLQNSVFCTTIINNNLHLTNWHRKQGCKCQYKHIVDWCGCSPNDFLPEDLHKIKALSEKPTYFARKFEAIINQEIMNGIDVLLWGGYPKETASLDSFWLNEYHFEDKSFVDDVAFSFYYSFARMTLDRLNHNQNDSCHFLLRRILEINVFKRRDSFKGFIVTFEVEEKKNIKSSMIFESLLIPFQLFKSFELPENQVNRLKSLKVGTNYDPKEELFRNYGNFFGPESDIVVEFRWFGGQSTTVVTAVFIDPADILAASYDITVAEGNNIQVHTYRPELRKPLRPGLWTLKILYAWQTTAELKFLILPYSHLRTVAIDPHSAFKLHNGPSGTYTDEDFNALNAFLQLGNSETLKNSSIENARKHGKNLLKWVDRLVEEMWYVGDTCKYIDQRQLSSSCPLFSNCRVKQWSIKFSDTKSEIKEFKFKSGILR